MRDLINVAAALYEETYHPHQQKNFIKKAYAKAASVVYKIDVGQDDVYLKEEHTGKENVILVRLADHVMQGKKYFNTMVWMPMDAKTRKHVVGFLQRALDAADIQYSRISGHGQQTIAITFKDE